MINVIGLGYIGLPTALMLCVNGQQVVGTDKKTEVVETLRQRRITFVEDGMDALLKKAVNCGIRFSDVCVSADIYIIAVPTPYMEDSKAIDPTFVAAAVEDVLAVCPKGALIAIESTVAPGTINSVIYPLIKGRGFHIGQDIFLAHVPERILPGNMLHELTFNNRTIGADCARTGERLKAVYASFCKGQILLTDIKTAEMSKVVENTYRDINIAYANELAKICRAGGLDVYEVISIANQHPRVNILSPGPGVGGHCISVDPWFLVADYPSLTALVRSAREVNDSMPAYVMQRIREIMAEKMLSDFNRVGIYGLTYKRDVDDLRNSPTLQLLELIKNCPEWQSPKVYDPMIQKDVVEGQYHSLNAFLQAVDMVVIMVDHSEIVVRQRSLRGKTVLDTRHCVSIEGVERL